MNPFIYTYLKIQKVQPFTFPRYSEIDAVKKILKDSHGMLLYKEQANAITHHIASMSDEDKMEHTMAIKILTREIEKRQGTLLDHTFFRARAMFCYRNAYIKANYLNVFTAFVTSYL
jgi:DNA polymerase-3 subunit alpha